jgi:hypothetical protein
MEIEVKVDGSDIEVRIANPGSRDMRAIAEAVARAVAPTNYVERYNPVGAVLARAPRGYSGPRTYRFTAVGEGNAVTVQETETV